MNDSLVAEATPVVPPIEAAAPRWHLMTRIAFRFCFIYFGLYILLTQMFPAMVPLLHFPPLEVKPMISTPVFWVIRHIFNDSYRQLAIVGGSGDKMFDWVFALCLLSLAALITVLWSVIDRKRANYIRMHKWFRVYVRFALATTFLSYGMVKAIPMQMPAPPLTRLLEPYGNFSPMGALWYSIGASLPYERITGCAELTAAALLFIPRTATLGAIVALFDSLEIFSLNMTYDVPVKLFSFHLVLMSIFLLAPEMKRLLNVLVLNRMAEPSTQPPLGTRPRAIFIGVIVQVVLAGYFFGSAYLTTRQRFYTVGNGAPQPPLYGVWIIDKMQINGIERPPLVTDYERWRRVVVQSTGNQVFMAFWRMDDTFFQMPAFIDLNSKTIRISQGQSAQAKDVGKFSLDQPSPDKLNLEGALQGKKVLLETTLFPREKFLLVRRGFNWIQELPFNR
jgi:hypothetical protein